MSIEKRKYEKKLLRLKALDMLGNKCEQCGNTDVRVFQFHHINGNGGNGNKREDSGTTYRRIINGANDIILLCANCHIIWHLDNKDEMICFLPEKKVELTDNKIQMFQEPINVKIIQLRNLGLSHAKIAERVPIGRSAIGNRLKKLGLV